MGLLQPTRLAAQVARAPIQLPQTVENGSSNTKLGITAELHMLGAVVLVQGIDQSENASVHQILQRNVAGQAFVDAASDVTHLRELFHKNPFSLLGILPGGITLRSCFRHLSNLTLMFQPFNARFRATAPAPWEGSRPVTAPPPWAGTAPADASDGSAQESRIAVLGWQSPPALPPTGGDLLESGAQRKAAVRHLLGRAFAERRRG